jgi:hypothetical protein
MGSLGGDDSIVEAGCGDGIKKKAVWQGKDLVIIVGASVVVQAAGQGICTIGGTWLMEEADVVVTEGQDVAGKAAVDFLGATIILKVLVVSEDIDDEFGA